MTQAPQPNQNRTEAISVKDKVSREATTCPDKCKPTLSHVYVMKANVQDHPDSKKYQPPKLITVTSKQIVLQDADTQERTDSTI
jgi:hypothetical protein